MSAMKTAKEMNVKQLTSAQVVPGTNIYTTTGANPMLDMNIDLSTDLGYEEESNTDDRTSLNSLDENNLDMTEKPQKTSSNMILDMNIRSDNDEEPLTAALAERDKNKKPEESDHVLINPAFNTTDL
ncbi:cadherin-related family member 2-like [Protopterus annectens]|uniref:cadherin-related family member 2-like n=1 Tax=Protopterus annectens TaxID=7888 RepID=UPI001CFBB260|nr:cadherin-related family member 2-like [Protopterus annectens]